jgi:Mg-chelatase subunit ChlD
MRRRLTRARASVAAVKVSRTLLHLIAELCARLKVDGHRGELTITRAARSLAAFEGRREATAADVERVAEMSLRHRLRRDPLEQTSGGSRIRQALDELSGATTRTGNGGASGGRGQTSHDDVRRQKKASTHDASVGATTNEARGRGEQSQHQGRGKDASAAAQEEKIMPPTDARLPEGLQEQTARMEKPRAMSAPAPARRGAGARSAQAESGGRYARALSAPTRLPRIALDATLRVAAPMQTQRCAASSAPDKDSTSRLPASTSRLPATTSRRAVSTPPRALHLAPGDLRYKQFRRKTGTLYIVAVDTSGSMAVNRISQAKGALAQLLRRSYINRDRVALIGFRERDAALLLAPSQSPARAKRLLDALPVGGATPLSAALLRALEVAERAARGRAQRIMLVIFTDGRANVSLRECATQDRAERQQIINSELAQLGAALQRACVSVVVVETQNRFTSGGEGLRLADALGARCVHLPTPDDAHALTEALRARWEVG